MEFRFIEKSAKNLENFNLDEGILVVSKLLRGKMVIFPNLNNIKKLRINHPMRPNYSVLNGL